MRLSEWLAEGVGGPGRMRFVIQPVIAILLAVRDGRRDAHGGSAPFFYRLFFRTGERRELLRSAWSTLVTPLAIAFVIDSILQIVILKSYRLRDSIGVAVLLVGLPYSMIRGFACRVTRVAMRHRHRHP